MSKWEEKMSFNRRNKKKKKGKKKNRERGIKK